jgi:DNA polymerase III delta prime subunit
LNERPKVVILDEFDYSNASSIQPALRGAIEEFAKNCRFILTCNYKNRIIEPIHSRCTVIEFSIPAKDKPKMAKEFMTRCENILKAEKVEYDPKVLSELIIKFFPDFRRVLNELQRYSVSGKIDVGILADTKNQKITDLMGFMKAKDFSSARKWVAGNMDNSQIDLFRAIYDGLYENLTPSCIPQAILILAEYQYKAAFVADQEINTAACVVELMLSSEFK